MKPNAPRCCHDRDMSADDSVVRIGSRVRVLYADADDEDQFVIVSPEMDRAPDRLSADAPLGRALLGVRAGQPVALRAPGGVYTVVVVSIERETEEVLSS